MTLSNSNELLWRRLSPQGTRLYTSTIHQFRPWSTQMFPSMWAFLISRFMTYQPNYVDITKSVPMIFRSSFSANHMDWSFSPSTLFRFFGSSSSCWMNWSQATGPFFLCVSQSKMIYFVRSLSNPRNYLTLETLDQFHHFSPNLVVWDVVVVAHLMVLTCFWSILKIPSWLV